MTDVLLLHNPHAGKGDWSRKALLKLLKRSGFRPQYCDLAAAAKDPSRLDHGEFVIVAGGDGAIRQAGLLLLERHRPMAPLPLGTANNIVRSFNLSSDPAEIVEGWRHPKTQPFDAGTAVGPWGEKRFFEGVGFGLIGRSIAVIDAIDETAVYEYKKRKPKLHRDLCVTTALANEMQPVSAQVSIDGCDVSDDYLLLEVLNIRRAGPGVELAPQANPADGRFDVISVTSRQRSRLLHMLKARLAETKHVRSLTTRKARTVVLGLKERCDIRIDDTTNAVPAGTKVKITVEPGALRFVLPG